MALDDDYQSSVLSYPTHAELYDVLMEHFEVLDEKLVYGLPTFIVKWRTDYLPEHEVQERVFKQVAERAESLRVWPLVRWRNKASRTYIIRFVPIEKPAKSDVRINYALFIATLGTIALAGFWQATSPIFLTLFYPHGYTVWDIAFVTLFFMAALMGIIGTHEAGHYFAAKRRGIEATPPYFIPGLPYIGGTFGAFIQQKSPPMNREDLYDLGVAGPLAGFVVTVVVLIAGFLLSVPVTAEQLAAIEATYPGQSGELGVPYLFTLMEYLFAGFIPPGGTLYMHPLAFASWIGMLVTALNLFPISQLDGGHALRAIVEGNKHKYVGWAGIAIMLLLGYYMMAILILVISQGGEHPGPLNDTIEISAWRKILFIFVMIILVLCIPPLWQMIGIF
ncbi:MAG: site-2 protease family protein [Candidatus Thorarchaeota archaeon]|nr:site-2 protease family protein [Candidatus Thorarchaeota archaeon]